MISRIPIYQYNNKQWTKINDIKQIKYLNKIKSPFGEWIENIYFQFNYKSKTCKMSKLKIMLLYY